MIDGISRITRHTKAKGVSQMTLTCHMSKANLFIHQIDAEKVVKNETNLPDYQIPIDKVLNFPESLERKFMN